MPSYIRSRDQRPGLMWGAFHPATRHSQQRLSKPIPCAHSQASMRLIDTSASRNPWAPVPLSRTILCIFLVVGLINILQGFLERWHGQSARAGNCRALLTKLYSAGKWPKPCGKTFFKLACKLHLVLPRFLARSPHSLPDREQRFLALTRSFSTSPKTVLEFLADDGNGECDEQQPCYHCHHSSRHVEAAAGFRGFWTLSVCFHHFGPWESLRSKSLPSMRDTLPTFANCI